MYDCLLKLRIQCLEKISWNTTLDFRLRSNDYGETQLVTEDCIIDEMDFIFKHTDLENVQTQKNTSTEFRIFILLMLTDLFTYTHHVL